MRGAARIVVLLVALAPVCALADPATADRLAEAAATLAGEGHPAEAAQQFRKAFAEDPRPVLMCNVGVAYYKAKELAHAQRYLEQCILLGSSLEAAFIDNLREVLKVVEANLRADKFAPVEVLVQPGTATIEVTGSTDEPFVGTSHLWLSSGKHELVVRADGYVERRVPVDITDPKVAPVTVKLERVQVDRPPPAHETGQPSTRPAVIASIATGTLGVATLVTYLYARNRASGLDDTSLTLDRYNQLADSAHLWQNVSLGLGIAAGVGAVVSSYLWYRALHTPASLEVNASGSGASVSLSGSW